MSFIINNLIHHVAEYETIKFMKKILVLSNKGIWIIYVKVFGINVKFILEMVMVTVNLMFNNDIFRSLSLNVYLRGAIVSRIKMTQQH